LDFDNSGNHRFHCGPKNDLNDLNHLNDFQPPQPLSNRRDNLDHQLSDFDADA